MRAAGKVAFVEKAVELGAGAADAETLAEIERTVAGIAGGDQKPLAPKTTGTTFEDFAMSWVRGELAANTLDEVDEAIKGGAELEDIPPATWSRFDLRRGVVNIDRDKTGEPRPIPLDPGVWRALQAWRDMHPNAKPTDPVFVDLSGKPIDGAGLAETFREAHLRPALRRRTWIGSSCTSAAPCASPCGCMTCARASSRSPSPTGATNDGCATARGIAAGRLSATGASLGPSKSSS